MIHDNPTTYVARYGKRYFLSLVTVGDAPHDVSWYEWYDAHVGTQWPKGRYVRIVDATRAIAIMLDKPSWRERYSNVC